MGGEDIDVQDTELMLQTTKNLIKEMEGIDSRTANLQNSLKQLGETFKDEGYQVIEQLVEQNKKYIDNNKTNFNDIVTAMTKYINILLESDL